MHLAGLVMDGPRRALSPSCSLWISFQNPNMQRVLSEAILCPGHVGSGQSRKDKQQEMGKQKQPVLCGS